MSNGTLSRKVINQMYTKEDILNAVINDFKNPKEDYEKVKNIATGLLSKCVSDDYVERIIDNIIYDIIYDVITCADLDNYNEDDVRLAISRSLCDKLKIEY